MSESRAVTALFATTIVLAAALMFSVEPMAARMVLPSLGGAPAVWTACMLFFQTTLLAGYAYVHFVSNRWNPNAQALSQVGLALASLACLPLDVSGTIATRLANGPGPTLGLLMALTSAVGPPFFVLSTTAPMLQHWFQRTGHPSARDPYFLYAASNAGSLAALIAYPLLVEPRLGLARQSGLWGQGFVVLGVLVFACAIVSRLRPVGFQTSANEVRRRVDPLAWGGWVVLALIPSSLLLGVTTHLTTDLAAIPLLWVVPLALYLVSFIVVFATRPRLTSAGAARVFPGLLIAIGVVLGAGLVQSFWIPLHLLTFFVAAVLCHGELARRRPPANGLTAFYLATAVGGAAGGLFNALVAPLVFDRVAEYPLALVAAGLVAPFVAAGAGLGAFHRGELMMPALIGTIAAVVCANLRGVASSGPGVMLTMIVCGLSALVAMHARTRPVRFALTVGALVAAGGLATGVTGRVLHQERDFFGVLKVTETPDGQAHRLFHGSTLHGQQSLEPTRRSEPLTYFSRRGPVGDVFSAYRDQRQAGAKVAVTGVGVGTLAAYAEPGDRWTFFEIDPAVVRVARNPNFFTYFSDCRARSLDVVVGDARLTLAKAPARSFDLIVLDAFSSDSIPVHLLNREAVRMYRGKLAEGGWLVFNITNRYLDLAPVLALLAKDAGWSCRVRLDTRSTPDDRAAGRLGSIWAVMAADEADLGSLARAAEWLEPATELDDRVWTDDYSNIFTHFRIGPPRSPSFRPTARAINAFQAPKPVGFALTSSQKSKAETASNSEKGPARAEAAPCDSLEYLLDHPSEFAKMEVVPDGLYMALGTDGDWSGGPFSVRLAKVAVTVSKTSVAAFRPTGSPWTVAVDPNVARNLNTIGLAPNTPRRLPPASFKNTNAAVVTFRVVPKVKGDGREWIPELVRLEFLVGLNATKVVNGKFKDAFRSILVTPEPGKLLGISPRKDWPKRLGASYLNQLRRQVRQDRARKDDRAMEPLGTFPGPSTGEPP